MPSSLRFENALAFTCKIAVEAQEIDIMGGNITAVDLTLTTSGFSGSVQFLWHDDPDLQALFCQPELMTVTLTLQTEEEGTTLTLQGLATEKILLQEHVHTYAKELPIVLRDYKLYFYDKAQVLWKQHFPTRLYTDTTMQTVIEEHNNGVGTIQYELQELSVKQSHIALGLGAPGNRASFYDFIEWYMADHYGVLEFDYTKLSYLLKTKEYTASKEVALEYAWIHTIACRFPELVRAESAWLNSYVEDSKTKPFDNPYKQASVQRAELRCTPVGAHFEERVQKKPAYAFHKHTLDVHFKTVPPPEVIPGAVFHFQKKGWSDKLYYKADKYRFRSLRIQAQARQVDYLEANTRSNQVYWTEVQAIAEMHDDQVLPRPSGPRPQYPFYVEGKIVSEVGKKETLNYQITRDEETAQEYYGVEIPLWENQKVKATFQPKYTGGQFYFPLCKGERVLVAFDLLAAQIDQILSWWPKARLPLEKQGNQIVFAPKADDDYTLLLHSGEDDGSIFTIERHFQQQTQTIRIQHKAITLELKKEDEAEALCTICLDTEGGITVTNQHKDAQKTQKIFLDGESIISTCKGPEDNSSVVQKPDQVVVTCKKFIVEAEEINLHAKEKGLWKADKELTLTSEVINIHASQTLSQQGGDVSIVAQKALKMSSKTTTAEGQTSLTLKGAQWQAEGSTVAITSKSTATFSGKVTTLEGQLTSVKGSLVKIN